MDDTRMKPTPKTLRRKRRALVRKMYASRIEMSSRAAFEVCDNRDHANWPSQTVLVISESDLPEIRRIMAKALNTHERNRSRRSVYNNRHDFNAAVIRQLSDIGLAPATKGATKL